MDFREGVKRIYIIFSLCILVVPTASYWDEFPSKDRIDRETSWKIESEVALQIGVKSWEMPKIDMPNAEFIGRYCSGKLVFTKSETPDVKISENAVICETHKERRDSFWVEQAKWGGWVALVTALTAIGLLAAFLLIRWVFNGFFPAK